MFWGEGRCVKQGRVLYTRTFLFVSEKMHMYRANEIVKNELSVNGN